MHVSYIITTILFKTADYPLLVTGDLEVGKPETTRIKSRRIAISSTKW